MRITGQNRVDCILFKGHSCPKMLGWMWTCSASNLFALFLPPSLQHCTLQWMSDVFQIANFWHKASMPPEAAFKVMGPGRHWPDSALQTEADREERWELILKLMFALFQKRDLTWLIFPHIRLYLSNESVRVRSIGFEFCKVCGVYASWKQEKRKSQMGSPCFFSPRQRNGEQAFTRHLRSQ